MTTCAEDNFGVYRASPNSTPVPIRRFTLTNSAGTEAQVINYGARLTSLKVKDKHSKVVDVALGEDTFEKYLENTCYFGCTVGRVANRINGGKFMLNGKEVTVALNRPPVHLHGGLVGFDKKVWGSHVAGDSVTFTYVSADGEEGYPGQLTTHVTYQLTEDSQLVIRYKAMTDRPTPVNLTNHSYWNLGGHDAGRTAILRHSVQIFSDEYLEVDSNCLVTGAKHPVTGGYDFRTARPLGNALSQLPSGGGFDNNYCLKLSPDGSPVEAARVYSPDTGIVMDVLTDQPGVQFYTGNFLGGITGKAGANYEKQGAFCLETQKYPDAVNHPEFPNTIVNPGELYEHTCIYKFSVEADV